MFSFNFFGYFFKTKYSHFEEKKKEVTHKKFFFSFKKKFLFVLGVREVILMSGEIQNYCPFLKTDSLVDTFFGANNFQKNYKCYGEKVLKNFLTQAEIQKFWTANV